MLRRYFQQSAILSVTLTLIFRNLSIPLSQFSGVKPSYGARATEDCRIPELMKDREVILRRRKIDGKSLDKTKPSYKSLSR
jgi:hypothetical protein